MTTDGLSAEQLDRLLADTLPAGSLFAVGGRVRDELRARLDGEPRPAKDLDYVVVGVALGDLVERLRRIGRADVVGAAFAVVKLTVGATTVDVALPRRERSTGSGHRDFEVEWGEGVPLEDDLARRDFRMNMLARALPGDVIVDPYRGEADIRARRIDLLRSAAFLEDPLRMLRACQFAARFEYAISDATMREMRAAAPLVTTVSPERIRDELEKLLRATRPSIGLEAMRHGGLLANLLPEIAEGIGVTQNVYHAFDVYEHNLRTMDATSRDDLVLRLAGLLHDVAKPLTRTVDPLDPTQSHFYRHEIVGETITRTLLGRLRFSSDVVESVSNLVRHHMYEANPEFEPKTIRRFIRRVGEDCLARQFALRGADIVGSGLPTRGDGNERFQARVADVLAQQPPLSVRDLAISGSDVIAALIRLGQLPPGSRGGPQVGAMLRRLLEVVTDEPARNERAALLAAVEEAARAAESGV